MFVPLEDAPKLCEAGVHALCLSLNSPVVHSDGLPLGRARAAIAFHDSQSRDPVLTVVLRSLEAERTAVFEFDGALREADEAVAIATSFGESLGFLFDDELIGAGRVAEALASWRSLTGQVADDAADPRELPGESGETVELLLDDEYAESRCEAPREPDLLPEARKGSSSRALSKFRRGSAIAEPRVGAEPVDIASLDESCGAGRQAPRDPGVIGRLLACF